MSWDATTLDEETTPREGSIPNKLDLIRELPAGENNIRTKTSTGVVLESHTSNKILKVAGPTVYVQHYDRNLSFWDSARRRAYDVNKKPEPVRRPDSIKRSAKKIKDIALCNYPQTPRRYEMPCFVTTTYADEQRAQPTNRKQHIADNNAFIRKLRKRYGNQLKFIGVFELQDGHRLKDKTKKPRNTIQAHYLVFNLRYNEWEELKKMWGLGTVHIERLKPGSRRAREASSRVGNYITKTAKYMSKEFGMVTKAGDNTYFPSHYLKHPETSTRADEIHYLLQDLLESGYVCTRSSEKVFNPYFQAWVVYEEWNPPDS